LVFWEISPLTKGRETMEIRHRKYWLSADGQSELGSWPVTTEEVE